MKKEAKDYTKESYYRNRESEIERCKLKQKREREEKPIYCKLKTMVYRSRVRAKKKGIDHSISLEDVVYTERCPVLDIPLNWFSQKYAQDDSPSLDRVIPERGYIKGNVIIISNKANRIKQNATSEEILKVGSWLDALERDKGESNVYSKSKECI